MRPVFSVVSPLHHHLHFPNRLGEVNPGKQQVALLSVGVQLTQFGGRHME
jgi:hypothetical protein